MTSSIKCASQASPEAFQKKMYGIEIEQDSTASSYVSPFHSKIYLQGDRRVEVPWSDPYLLAEWFELMGESGFVHREFTFLCEGRPMLDVFLQEDEVVFVERDSQGKSGSKINIPIPGRAPVEVELKEDSDEAIVVVHGLSIPIHALFPVALSLEARKNYLREIGKALQRIPRPIMEKFVRGEQAEVPLHFLVASEEELKKRGVLRSNENLAGEYSNSQNELWIDTGQGPAKLRKTLFHEVGGHVFSDYSVASDDSGDLIDSEQSAFKDYYKWKLSRIFTPDELEKFIKNELQKEDLQFYYRKLSQRFFEPYAFYGKGIVNSAIRPAEDFAVSMGNFYDALDHPLLWGAMHTREPLLKLAGINYLIYQYDLKKLGSVSRETVFSKESFEKILGVSFNDSQFEAMKQWADSQSAGSNIRQGASFAFRFGEEWWLPSRSGGASSGQEYFGLLGGYVWGDAGVGLLTHIGSGERVWNNDYGIWGRLSHDMGALTLYAEPSAGVRYAAQVGHATDKSYWGGGSLGVGLWNGAIHLGANGTIATDQRVSLGLALGVDIPLLFRRQSLLGLRGW